MFLLRESWLGVEKFFFLQKKNTHTQSRIKYIKDFQSNKPQANVIRFRTRLVYILCECTDEYKCAVACALNGYGMYARISVREKN